MKKDNLLEHDWYPKPFPDNVWVGDRCWIYSSFAFLHFRAKKSQAVQIGTDTGIYNGTFFDLGPDATVEIGDFCALVGVIINTNGHVVIGDYSFFAHEVVMADSPFGVLEGPNKCANGKELSASQAGEIIIGENCWIGMRAVLLSGTNLGKSCIVGANAVVDFEAPPFSIIAGNPAKIVGSVAQSKIGSNPESQEK